MSEHYFAIAMKFQIHPRNNQRYSPNFSLGIGQQNLEQIVAESGYNCTQFAELVKENELILDKMKVSWGSHDAVKIQVYMP